MTHQPNILLITVHALRADHLGAYGYGRPTSPRIDALAREGVLAERLLCPALPSGPSSTTLYTGQHPITHGIVAEGGRAQLDREAPFLVQSFMEAGYTTCAADVLHRLQPWFARGYEYLIDPSVRRSSPGGASSQEINRRAIPWLRAHRDEPFFIKRGWLDPNPTGVVADSWRGKFRSFRNRHSISLDQRRFWRGKRHAQV